MFKNANVSKSVLTFVVALTLTGFVSAQNWSDWKGRSLKELNRSQASRGSFGSAQRQSTRRVGEARYRTGTRYGAGGASAHLEAQANAYRVNERGAWTAPDVKSNGQTVFTQQASGEAEIVAGAHTRNEAGVSLGSNPRLHASTNNWVGQKYTAEGEYQANAYGASYGASGSAEAWVGAEANANASLSRDGLQGGASAFAGEKASATGGVNAMGVGASGTAEAWAGAGVEASGDVTYKKGKFRMKADLGVGLGVGGKLGFDVTVDTNQVKKDARRFGKNVEREGRNFGRQVKRDVRRTGKTIQRGVSRTGRTIQRGVRRTGRTIQRGVRRTGKTIQRGVRRTGKTIQRGVRRTGKTIQRGVRRTGKTVQRGVRRTGKTIQRGVRRTGRTINKAGRSVKKGFNRAGRDIKKGVSKLKFW